MFNYPVISRVEDFYELGVLSDSELLTGLYRTDLCGIGSRCHVMGLAIAMPLEELILVFNDIFHKSPKRS